VRVAKGTDGQVLVSDGTDASWGTLAGDVSGQFDATTVTDLTISSEADGDLLQFDGSNWVRVAKGTDGQVLVSDGTDASWGTLAGDCSGQFDATQVTDLTISSQADGDLLQFDGSNWIRVAKGTDGQVLVSDGTDASWGTLAGDCSGQFDATTVTDLTIASQADGDLLQFDGSNWIRVPKGTNKQQLTSDGTDVAWGDDEMALHYVFEDGALTATDTALKYLPVPWDCTVTKWVGLNGTEGTTSGEDKFKVETSGTSDDPIAFGAADVIEDTAAQIGYGDMRGSTTTIANPTLSAGAWLLVTCTGTAGVPGQDHQGYIVIKRR